MPLLNRQPFDKAPLPTDLKPDEEVFFCGLTGEVFRDYDDFFKRTILLNSLVWTCSATGRTNLTFEEALLSERTSKESLENFPSNLARPLLFLCRLTKRSRLEDLLNDVYGFVRNHYFVGEVVEVVLGLEK
ncbi:unnamed protein product [Soboliphyme baturini]|uniref:WAC domain-containing protein n=1 Tax=Soboliphyme baturini TaxID=241478 RepID=A0A183ITB2_9BILA|nr:unnamed protein product [Soboliphyme baturini]